MPYIVQGRRDALVNDSITDYNDSCLNAGELNYAFTVLINRYLLETEFNYQRLNDCIGALECCKHELYRRLAGPYEDLKITANGDVYDKQLVNKAKKVKK